MSGSTMNKRILAFCLGACCAFVAQAQQKLDWLTIPPVTNNPGVSAGSGGVSTGGGGVSTIQEPETSQVKPADPKYRGKIHTELAAAYYQAGNMAVALEETRIALEADPENVQALSVRGLVHARLKENAKAEDDFQRALKMSPRNPDVNNNYGWFLCDIGQPRQSIQYFLNALKDPLYETPEVAYANAGSCAMKAGDLDGAQNYLLEALRLSRNPAPATRYQLADLFYQRGNLDEAKVYVGEAIKAMEPPSAEALWLAVRLERKLGNKASEGNYASQLRSRYPTSKEYQSFLKGNFE